MTTDPFHAALKFVLAAEGGFSDNPLDSGHATMRGITLATYRAWEGDDTLTPSDLRAIDNATVEAIYRHQYWDRVAGDKLPHGVALMVFDFAVNAGPGRAVRALQALIHANPQDGIIGPVTLGLAVMMDHVRLIDSYASLRRGYYESLPTFPTFGRGWLSRLDACQKLALTMR